MMSGLTNVCIRDYVSSMDPEATHFIDVDQLAVSPQCGFASGISGNDLTTDEQWSKLELLNEVSDRVWGA